MQRSKKNFIERIRKMKKENNEMENQLKQNLSKRESDIRTLIENNINNKPNKANTNNKNENSDSIKQEKQNKKIIELQKQKEKEEKEFTKKMELKIAENEKKIRMEEGKYENIELKKKNENIELVQKLEKEKEKESQNEMNSYSKEKENKLQIINKSKKQKIDKFISKKKPNKTVEIEQEKKKYVAKKSQYEQMLQFITNQVSHSKKNNSSNLSDLDKEINSLKDGYKERSDADHSLWMSIRKEMADSSNKVGRILQSRGQSSRAGSVASPKPRLPPLK